MATVPRVNMTEFPPDYCGVRGGQGRDSEELSSTGSTDFIGLARLFVVWALAVGLFYWLSPP